MTGLAGLVSWRATKLNQQFSKTLSWLPKPVANWAGGFLLGFVLIACARFFVINAVPHAIDLAPTREPTLPAVDCRDWSTVASALDLHVELSPFLADDSTKDGTLYTFLGVPPTAPMARLRDAPFAIVQRLRQAVHNGNSALVEASVYRAAMFLEDQGNRRVYDEVFLPVLAAYRATGTYLSSFDEAQAIAGLRAVADCPCAPGE